MRNERTSKRIAKIAARILGSSHRGEVMIYPKDNDTCAFMPWRDFRTLAASALTQAPDRKPKRASKPKRRARRK